jgi:hypothetical protein
VKKWAEGDKRHLVGFDGKCRYIWSGLQHANKQGGTADNLRPFLGMKVLIFVKDSI